MVFAETFEITSNIAQLTFKKKEPAIKKLKINSFIYTTASLSNYFMLLILSGWTKDQSFQSVDYTKLVILPRTTLTSVDYEAQNDTWDVIFDQPQPIGTHILECYINNDPSNSDISPSNPVYLEIFYE